MRFKRKSSIFTVLLVIIMFFMSSTNAFAAAVGTSLTSPESGWSRIDGEDKKIIYGGRWIRQTDSGCNTNCWNGSHMYCDSNTSTIIFKFYGTKLRLTATPYNNKRTDNIITIDNVAETFSEYNSTNVWQGLVYEKTNLDLAVHTVVIRPSLSMSCPTQNVALDAIDIDDTGYLVDTNQLLNLKATPSDTNITLTWDAVDGATSYNIKRSETANGPYTTVSSVTGSEISYADKDVINGITYYYVVSAIVSEIEIVQSNEVSAISTATTVSGDSILDIYLDNGTLKEYNLNGTEIDDFLTWYDNKSAGAAKAYYIFNIKGTLSPYKTVKHYIPYDKILYFEVKEYRE